MCGLLSVINSEISPDDFSAALDTLHHRGPDDRGSFIESSERVAIGHTRLSIIDLETGHQPLFNSDKSLVLTCNGELYGFEKIRESLQAQGHKFLTKSDSEIIIHLYTEYGDDMYEHLRGEFSFILYDRKKKKVIACRDRFGIKPLFWCRSGDGTLLASEVKALFATGLKTAELDPTRIRNSMSYVTSHSIFKDIEIVPPASKMTIDLTTGERKIETYWQLDLPNYETLETTKDFDQLKRELRDHFDEAVSLRLRADVPVGVFLSGGIDSAAVIGSITKDKNRKVKAFSIAFGDDAGEFNESSLAKKMADHVDAEYFELKATKEKLLTNFEQMLWHTEIPTHNLHGVGKFLLSELAKKHVSVCLTGEGGDETFLGYDYFKLNRDGIPMILNNISGKSLNWQPSEKQSFVSRYREATKFLGFKPMTEIVAHTGEGLAARVIQSVFHRKHQEKLKEEGVLKCLRKEVSRDEIDGRGDVSQLQYYSLRHVMAPYILNMLGDRQEMSHSLEGRTPLLDHHLFEFARQIPLHFKINGDEEKYIFKEMNKDRVIPEIYQRQKWPFVAPSIVVRKRNHPTMDRLIETHLSKQALEDGGIFDAVKVRRILNWYLPLFSWHPRVFSRFNSLLTFVLSVQILHSHFVKPTASQ